MSDCTEYESQIQLFNTQLEALRLEKKGLVTQKNEASEQLGKCTTELNSMKTSVPNATRCMIDLEVQQEQVIHLENQAKANTAKLDSCLKETSDIKKKQVLDEQQVGTALSELAESQKMLEDLKVKNTQCKEELDSNTGELLKMGVVMIDLQKCDKDRDMFAQKLKDCDHKSGQIIQQWQMAAGTVQMENEILKNDITDLKKQAVIMPTDEFLPLEIMERAFTVVRSYVPDHVENQLRLAGEESLDKVSKTLSTTKKLVNEYMFEGIQHGKAVADSSKVYARSLSRQLSEKANRGNIINPYIEKIEPYKRKAEPYVQVVADNLNKVKDRIQFDAISNNVSRGYGSLQQGVSKSISKLPSSEHIGDGLTQFGDFVLSPIKNNPCANRFLPRTIYEFGLLVVMLVFARIFISSTVQTIYAGIWYIQCAVKSVIKATQVVIRVAVNITKLVVFRVLRIARFFLKTILSPLKIFKTLLLPYRLFQWISSKVASNNDSPSTKPPKNTRKKNRKQ